MSASRWRSCEILASFDPRLVFSLLKPTPDSLRVFRFSKSHEVLSTPLQFIPCLPYARAQLGNRAHPTESTIMLGGSSLSE